MPPLKKRPLPPAILLVFAVYSAFDVAAALRFLGISLGALHGDAQPSNGAQNVARAPQRVLALLSKFLDNRPAILNLLAVSEPIALLFIILVTVKHLLILVHFLPLLLLFYWSAARYRYSPFSKYAWSRFGELLFVLFADRTVPPPARRLKPGIQRLQDHCLHFVELLP